MPPDSSGTADRAQETTTRTEKERVWLECEGWPGQPCHSLTFTAKYGLDERRSTPVMTGMMCTQCRREYYFDGVEKAWRPR